MRLLSIAAFVFLVGWPTISTAGPPIAQKEKASAQSVDVDGLLSAFRHEPSIRATQKAALRHAGLAEADARKWAARARTANLIPELQGEIAWLDQRDAELRYSEDIETAESGQMYRDGAENRFVDDERLRVLYSLEADLDLGGLIFDRDEIAASREVRRRELARRKLVGLVTKLYFERRKSQVLRLAAPPKNWRERLEQLLTIERLTARIDALTGGWFEGQLRRSGEGENRDD